MKRLLLLLLVCVPLLSVAQTDDLYDHTGVQYATQGTDFWVCFPRTYHGFSPNVSKLYVVCEHDCDVTVEAPRIGWFKTFHIMHRQMCGPDTNYIEIPQVYSRFYDTITFYFPLTPHYDHSGSLMNQIQPNVFHVTSTDTISLFTWIYSVGVCDVTNVLPTEMLRDEYVVQVFPKFLQNRYGLYMDSTALPRGCTPNEYDPEFIRQLGQMVEVVGVEDSTVVDIVLGDWDIVNRPKGDTITVTLNAGELFYMAGGEVFEKYCPLFAPYYYTKCRAMSSPLVSPELMPQIPSHTFTDSLVVIDTFAVDLSGTHIKARDCKRIAVFEGGAIVYITHEIEEDDTANTSDMLFEQSVPIRYEGTKFLIPNVFASVTDYIRITGLYDGTDITIVDALRGTSDTRHLSVDRGETEWFEMEEGEGPFYIETSHPAIVKVYIREFNMEYGDEAYYAVTPEEWWHDGQVNYGTITQVDANNNRFRRDNALYLFARTEDVNFLRVDDYPVGNYFSTISGTPYSYAFFPVQHSFNSEGTHHIESMQNKRFMAVMSSTADWEATIYNLPHIQHTGVSLWVNNIPAESFPTDTLMCHFDHVTFKAQNKRPADSLLWDFGDGTRVSFSHRDAAYSQPVPHTFPAPGRYTVMAVYIYEDEGCYTRNPDTLSVTLNFGGHVDSTLNVTMCEGSFFFRGHEFSYTGTHTLTTYWTTTGCDTLWTIDLVTCPHCHWEYDTVSPEDLPHTFNEHNFSTEVRLYPIYLDINDSCDSIIYYTLAVIPNWGEPPLDSTWVLVPNVFTPDLDGNNRFSIVCSPHIKQAEVMVFDRRGDFVAKFNGLTDNWDGTHNGRPCPQASYVYYIRYIDSHDNAWKTLTGTVTLLR